MTFLREGSAAIMLVTLTLSLQCAGMAAVIFWARTSFAPGVLKLGPIRSAMLIMRLMAAFICLRFLPVIHVLKLRQKPELDPSRPVHFRTVHGAGYKFLP